jgi:hypothetical protein
LLRKIANRKTQPFYWLATNQLKFQVARKNPEKLHASGGKSQAFFSCIKSCGKSTKQNRQGLFQGTKLELLHSTNVLQSIRQRNSDITNLQEHATLLATIKP